MVNENDHSGPAFPQADFWDEKQIGVTAGMTRRDYFAAHAPEVPPDFDFTEEPAPQMALQRLAGRAFNGRYVDLDQLTRDIKVYRAPDAAQVYGEEPVRIAQDYIQREREYEAATQAWKNRQIIAREVAWRRAYAEAMVSEAATAPVPGFKDPLVRLHILDLRGVIQEALTAMAAAVVHLETCEAGRISHPFKSSSLPKLLAATERAKGVL